MIDERKRREKVLNMPVDIMGREEAMALIEGWVRGRGCHQILTAYSEFFVQAVRDEEFRRVWEESDLVVADGVSALGAIRYKQLVQNADLRFQREILQRVWKFLCSIVWGLKVGWEVWQGKVGQTVTGVWLVEEVLRLAPEKGWRVFLLGGYGSTAEQLKLKVEEVILRQPEMSHHFRLAQDDKADLQSLSALSSAWIEADGGSQDVEKASEEEHLRVIKKVNEFKPDILLVAYGPVKQEKWIGRYKNKLKAKVAIGVGGTFDELSGRISRPPGWMDRHGLKWLWRLVAEPKRWRRTVRAVVVFPWMVWREEGSRKG